MIKRLIVVLANSVKNRGRCLAGKDVFSGEWIRIVGDESGRELKVEDNIKYVNVYGEFGLESIRPLQKFEVYLDKKAHSLNYQPENWIYCKDKNWNQNYTLSREELTFYVDNPPHLWFFYENNSDRVPFSLLKDFPYHLCSLYLIWVDEVKVYKRSGRAMRRRAVFEYKGIVYDLSLTDPAFKHLEGERVFKDRYLCVSLGEPYDFDDFLSESFCYKIVAAII